jgi:predicted nucleic acid-binding protein
MARILLDTSAYSAFMRGHAEVKGEVQAAEEVFMTPVVFGELIAGFLGGNRAKKNRDELQTFRSSSRVDFLNVDEETAARYAVILDGLRKAGSPIPTNDIWIAATAMQHGLRIVTTDPHYEKVQQVMATVYATPPCC